MFIAAAIKPPDLSSSGANVCGFEYGEPGHVSFIRSEESFGASVS